ncbi:MAG: 2-isopropylmalate synthase [Ruminococcaceae bacterium]|nr:2-isopropylmalate synthase [Oscillospiraceae bacterium]MBQ4048842.1 2-isopropylmalate synthase [Clostridia bacterium]
MLDRSRNSNLLEQDPYRYTLQDVDEPALFRQIYPYDQIPKVVFNHRRVDLAMPEDIWITDTSFRDGMQSQAPYSVEQMLDLFDMLHRLSGPNGVIRQTEFFVYSEKDRKAIEKCMERGYQFPEITTWIRATKKDFELVKSIGIKETGILVSCSDYHIFKKLRMSRGEAMGHYLSVISDAFDAGLVPRCHFEDITRADFYGFVVPFVNALMDMSRDAGIPVKIRVCDTLGYGIPYPGVALPRSVPGIINGLRHYSGVPSAQLEWHGHNDFYKAVANATTAWLYGASAVNCSMLGIGERTGNVPLEAMVIEYASLRGTTDGMDTRVITEIAEYFEKNMGYEIPGMTPFVGRYFNQTRAGIHADGLMKDEEIYNIFDTKALLNRSAGVAINATSGLAGIAYWLNETFRLTGAQQISKHSEVVAQMKEWIDHEYMSGRQTVISDEEMRMLVQRFAPELL